MDSIHIRRLTIGDLPQLSEVYEGFWGEASNVDKMREHFPYVDKDNNSIILVAMDAENPARMAGSVMGVVINELYGEARPFLLVENMAVHKDYQRMGIGRQLIAAMEAFGRERGCKSILLMTEPERTYAHEFYYANGFIDHSGFKKLL